MEKYSAYRDPGTGIQPFLTPVPPPQPSTKYLQAAWYPVGILIAAARSALVLILGVAYLFLVRGVFCVFAITPLVHRILSKIITSLIARLVLLIVGYAWIPVDVVSKKRGRGNNPQKGWNPRAGDIIVSNWASWVEILWLAFRFDPIFVLPISEVSDTPPSSTPTVVAHKPGRRTGTGSANIASPATRTATPKIPIAGFEIVSLTTIIRRTGLVPQFREDVKPRSLEDIRKNANRPIVVFPECTSSNGRGLLRFADVFKRTAAVKEYGVFIMCVRYDPPATFAPSPTLSIPSLSLNPLSHLFTITAAFTIPQVTIRLLTPDESPSSPLFLTSDVVGDIGSSQHDLLTESCAVLIAQLGKLKRMNLGWEDKACFLDFYRGKRSS